MTAKEKSETREAREIEKMKEAFAAPRPGGLRASAEALDVMESTLARHGVELSDILYLKTDSLKPNPNNEYPPLEPDEMTELVQDIRDKGILVPLITKPDGTIVCGHNRHRAAGEAGLERVPVQQILSALSVELEKDIMKSENDRRRGGKWSKEQKEKFVRENFGAVISEERRGSHKKLQSAAKRFNEPLGTEPLNLAKQIEKQSRGRITSGTAKRIIADLRKKTPKKPDSGSERLPAKDRRRGEKLQARLKTLRVLIMRLEKRLAVARKQEKHVIKRLQNGL